MRRYTVMPAAEAPPLCGTAYGTCWRAARVLRIDNYPWYAGGERQSTTARVMYDRSALHVQFRCRDRHIHSAETRLNGDVYLDSCVEMFAGVDDVYFNLEINCCGVIHLGAGTGRHGRNLVDAALAGRIKIATPFGQPRKAESPDDKAWWVAARIPFAVLRKFTGRPMTPRPGAVWRANFYRCGGRTDPQYACWNPIDWPQPDFHRPEFFGRLRFA